MKAGSLRLRLLLAAAVSIAAALIVAGIALTALFERQVRDRVMQELKNDLLQLAGAIEVSETGEVKVVRALADPRFDTPYSGKYWRIVQLSPALDPSRPLPRSRSLWDSEPQSAELQIGPEGELLVTAERTISIASKQGNISLLLVVGTHNEEIASPLARFRDQLIAYLSLIGLALTVAAWLQVSIGLRPLHTLRKQLSEMTARHAKRLEGEFPTEVQPLVSEFNGVLDVRDKSLARARHRAGDLAHGLLTPLTILSVVARELNKGKLHRQGAEIAAQVDSMRRHIDRSLVRARLSTGRGQDLTNLAEAVDAVVSTLQRLPGSHHIKWLNTVPEDLVVPIERDDLLELLGNLLDNARKFANTQVRVSFADAGIVIEDDGQGVADDQLPSIRQRGRRLDENQKGFGLGLAIVEDIIDLYELELTYGRSPLGGLQVNVAFDRDELPSSQQTG
jgi:signal transduction histidine kinase